MNKRIFKFRGKDVFTDAWRYGDLVHNQKVTTTGLEPRTMVGGYEVDPNTVCQFTGLFDKNGKEVYEGDILSIQGAHFFPCRIPLDLIWRVVFDQGAFCAYDERKKYVRGPLGNYDENITSKWEVKGNIHDPEWQGDFAEELNKEHCK